MKKPVDTAVILAAGLGSRLGDLKANRPKAFLQVGEETLIERSIGLLKRNGISKIIIGTGFEESYFQQLQKTHGEIITQVNPKYADSGSMYTLYLLRSFLANPFLLLEADLLYEEDALHQLLEDDREDLILASGKTQSGDEVYIQADSQGLLQNMSKKLADLDFVTGELVGICKLSTKVFDSMIRFADAYFANTDLHLHYEDTLVGIAEKEDIPIKVVEELLWCEIDDATHLQRAQAIIYPKIQDKEILPKRSGE